jgi:hypothetical protein
MRCKIKYTPGSFIIKEKDLNPKKKWKKEDRKNIK